MTSLASKRFYLFIRDHTISPRATGVAWRHGGSNSRLFHPATRTFKESLRPQNHYELFPETLSAGPPPHGPFEIDVRKLRREFLQLQSKAHPDMHTGDAKSRAEGLSMLINEAYKTLQDPLLRAQYLLSLRNIDMAEDETAKVDDPALLMEVLEMRETIEAIESETELVPLKASNDARITESVRALGAAFTSNNIEAAKTEAVRLRYWVNIRQSLNDWEKGKPVVMAH